MKRKLSRLLILAALVAQLAWLTLPESGSHPLSPRMRQAIETHRDSSQPGRDAAIDEAIRQDTNESNHRAIPVLILLLCANITLIYFFWNFGAQKNDGVKAR